MLTIGQKLQMLRQKHGYTQIEVANKLDISTSAYNQYEKDVIKPIRKINELASIFGVTTDYLLGNENTSSMELSKKEIKDVKDELEATLKAMSEDETLMFDGKPIDATTRDLIASSLSFVLEMERKKAKEKFTPKKYKK